MTAGAGRLLAVAAIVLFLFVGIPVVQQAYWDSSTASQTHANFNDSFTPVNGTVNTIASSDKSGVVYAPQNDVTIVQNGTTISQPGNWTWIRSNGTLELAAQTSFNISDTANVSGYYTVPSAEQNVTKEVGTLPTAVFGSGMMLAAGVLLVLLALGLLANTG